MTPANYYFAWPTIIYMDLKHRVNNMINDVFITCITISICTQHYNPRFVKQNKY